MHNLARLPQPMATAMRQQSACLKLQHAQDPRTDLESRAASTLPQEGEPQWLATVQLRQLLTVTKTTCFGQCWVAPASRDSPCLLRTALTQPGSSHHSAAENRRVLSQLLRRLGQVSLGPHP